MIYYTAHQFDYIAFILLTIGLLELLKYSTGRIVSKRYGKKITVVGRSFYITLGIVFILGWMATQYKGTLTDSKLKNEILFQATQIASTINEEHVEKLKFSLDDRENPHFLRIRSQMISYGKYLGNLRGIYSMIIRDGSIVFGPEDYYEDDPMASSPGQIYEIPDEPLKLSFDDGVPRVSGPFADEYGTFISAYAPVFSRVSGEIVLMVGIDILADTWTREIHKTRGYSMLRTLFIALIFFTFFAMIGVRDSTTKKEKWFFKHLEAILIFIMGTLLSVIFGMNASKLVEISEKSDFINLTKAKTQLVRQEFFDVRKNIDAMAGYIGTIDAGDEIFGKLAQPVIKSSIVSQIQWIELDDEGNARPVFGLSDNGMIADRKKWIGQPEFYERTIEAVKTGMSVVLEHFNESGRIELAVLTPVYVNSTEKAKGIIITAIDDHFLTNCSFPLSKFSDDMSYLHIKMLSSDGSVKAVISKVEDNLNCENPLTFKSAPLFVFGKTFSIDIVQSDSGLISSRLIVGMTTFVLIFLLSLLFAVFIASLRNRETTLEAMVKERTSEITEINERFNLAVTGSQDGIWDWNIKTSQLYLSPRWKEMIGYEDHELPNILDSFERRIHSDDKVRVMSFVDRYFKGEEEKYEIEFRFGHKDGSFIWVLARGEALRDENGIAYRMAGSHTDITDRKKTEEAIITAKKEADTANNAKSEFLANMSHEIRTPLNGIIGFADLLTKTVLNETQMQYLSNVSTSAHILLEVVNDILDFSKIEAGKLELEIQPVDISRLISEAAELIRPQIESKGVRFNVIADKELPQFLMIDSLRLRQVLVNLLSNAAKFTAHGTVELIAEVIEKEEESSKVKIRFSVKDTGIGIKKEHLNNLFKSFSQADPSTARKYGGTGLGLAISNRILEKTGSSIDVESEFGAGSTFSFDIVLDIADEIKGFNGASFKPDVSKREVIKGAEYKILVVEDNTINMVLTKIMLESIMPQSTILTAETGGKAIEIFKNEKPDLIFMDVQMPGMDGRETTVNLRKMETNQKRVPVIALTADAVEGEKERCLASGMDDFILKPVEESQIREIVYRWLLVPSDQIHFEKWKFMQTISGDYELLEKLIDFAKEDFPLKIKELRIHVSGNDKTGIKLTAHTLKGSALSMKFSKLASLAHELEKISANDAGKDLLNQKIDEIEKEFEYLLNNEF